MFTGASWSGEQTFAALLPIYHLLIEFSWVAFSVFRKSLLQKLCKLCKTHHKLIKKQHNFFFLHIIILKLKKKYFRLHFVSIPFSFRDFDFLKNIVLLILSDLAITEQTTYYFLSVPILLWLLSLFKIPFMRNKLTFYHSSLLWWTMSWSKRLISIQW
jgi:hypothetical protein